MGYFEKWDSNINDIEYDNKHYLHQYLVCVCKDCGDTRLYIHRFDSFSKIVNKYGWWDLFTVTRSSNCVKGFYFCQIDKFVLDHNHNINMWVTPQIYLGEEIDDDSPVWKFFSDNGMIAMPFCADSKVRCNTEKLHKLYCPEESYRFVGETITKKFVGKEISFFQIEEALNRLTDNEEIVENMFQFPGNYGNYPLTMEKVFNLSRMGTQAFMEDRASQYNCLVDDGKLTNRGENSILEKTEAVLAYYKDIHEKQKAAKTAAKKGKVS